MNSENIQTTLSSSSVQDNLTRGRQIIPFLVRNGRVCVFSKVENGKRKVSVDDDIKAVFSTQPGFILTREKLSEIENIVKGKSVRINELEKKCEDLNNEIREKNSLNEELVSKCDNLKLMNANMTFMTNVWLYQSLLLLNSENKKSKEIEIAAENVTNALNITMSALNSFEVTAKLIPKREQ